MGFSFQQSSFVSVSSERLASAADCPLWLTLDVKTPFIHANFKHNGYKYGRYKAFALGSYRSTFPFPVNYILTGHNMVTRCALEKAFFGSASWKMWGKGIRSSWCHLWSPLAPPQRCSKRVGEREFQGEKEA